MICGKATITIDGKNKTKDLLYVKGLRYNLLSVSKICNKGFNVTLHDKGCEIMKERCGRLVAEGIKFEINVYNLKKANKRNRLIGKTSECWLYNNFENLAKINSIDAVRDMPKIFKPANT